MERMIRCKTLIFCSLILFHGHLTTCSSDQKALPDFPRSGESPKTKVVLLGTGTPNAEPDRSGPAVAIIVNNTSYLIDAGPGIVRRASAAYQKGIKALDFTNLKTAFITHLHSDHTVGLPDLIFTPWVLGRNEPLELYGPPGIRSMVEHIIKAYQEDIRLRLKGLEPANPEGYKVNVHEIEPGMVYEDDNIRVRAFPVKHGSWKHAFGFRFESPDRTIVISGDTIPTESLVEQAKGCDVLIHEVYAQAWFERKSPEWKKYHASFHTSSLELAEIAKRIKPGLLVLYHQLLIGFTEDDLLAEIRAVYKGKVAYGHDLDVY